jgi:hypothetical protein
MGPKPEFCHLEARLEVVAFWQHALKKFNLKLSRPCRTIWFHVKSLAGPDHVGLGLGMHRFAIIGAGILSIVGFSGAGSAADLPVRAPVAAADPVLFSWTDCYVGGNLGGAISEDKTTGALGRSVSLSSTGFAGGGQIGCNYQYAPGWVAGVEGRADWIGLKSSHPETVTSFVTGKTVPSEFSLRNDFLASATARLGHTFADRWLVYARVVPPGSVKRSTMHSPIPFLGSPSIPARP